MPHPQTPARHFSSPPTRRLRTFALAVGAPFALLSVASIFGMQVELPALWHAWRHADASLPMIAFGALVAGPLLAFCVGE
ncbi:hypothetical protein [Cupriavidus necator]|uniref:hypothetical protein n=1 Tax=Cupriavidus necator TaxID=106590 RepID=UPI0005B34236|nr:hypothetical protein [Cupriavidus necator]